MISHSKRAIWLITGIVSVILGGIGVVLPLLPTTPFIILAAFAFGKSIPVWREWLVNNHIFGPMIRNWEETGAIAPRYKAIAFAMMFGALALSIYLSVRPLIIVVQALCLLAVFIFIFTRPNGRA